MLNPRTIESATRNPSREVLLVDGTGERGAGRLALRVRPGGPDGARAEWLALWWRGGRKRTGLLGRYPALSLRQARDLFSADWRPEIEAGRDPRHARDVANGAGTVEQLLEGYVASMKAQGKRSWSSVEAALVKGKRSAVKALGADTRAADVSSASISEWLAGFYRRGARVAADRYRAYLHAAFQWGAGSTHAYTRDGAAEPAVHFGLASNPVSVVPRDAGANVARDRALSKDELAQLWRGLDGEGFGLTTAPAIRLLICTGQRVTDALRAEGRDFDLKAKLWTIPAEKRKAGEQDHIVPLPPQAVAVVEQLIAIRGGGLLFPCLTRPEEPAPHQSVNQALGRWAEAAEVEAFQARDLRRTWKTLTGEARLSKEIRDRIQGHALNDVSSVHYDRYQYLREKREAMRLWSAWLAKAVADQRA